MRKLLLLLCIILSHWGIINAQDKKKKQSEQSTVSEARFTYLKETIVLFNE